MKGFKDPASTEKKVLLITAAAGGVGVWLVQLARLARLEVIAKIGNAKNDEFIRTLGASKTANYNSESLKSWAGREGQVDIVIDCIGGKTLEDAWYAIKNGGSLISICEPPEGKKPQGLEKKDMKNSFFTVRPDGEQLAEVSKLLEEGKCRAVVDSVWEFEDYEKALKGWMGVMLVGRL